uniref:Niemann-Pick C1 N-terminal domain-containing protein n=1 Tax=Strigamia maritima TaxID=126957 RepID=T1JDS6_STRMM
MKLLILLLFIFNLTGKALAEDTCVWYSHEFEISVNTVENKPAMLLNNTKLAEEFKNFCPTLADENGMFYICCDETLVTKYLKLQKQFLERCPTLEVTLEYMVTKSFADNLFESCYNVTNPSMGNATLDLLCKPWGKTNCTVEKWLTSLGNVTFWNQNEVIKNGKTYRPMNATTFPCNVGFGVSI